MKVNYIPTIIYFYIGITSDKIKFLLFLLLLSFYYYCCIRLIATARYACLYYLKRRDHLTFETKNFIITLYFVVIL